MIFTVFSENFLPENKLCSWLFTDLQNTHAFSWSLANCPDFLLAKKNHISFIIIYITIYIIAYPWLCLSMITLSLTHFGCAVIVPDASNNVQTIGTIIWKRYRHRRSQMTRMTDMTSIDRLHRVEFYVDDWEHRVNFEVIWKCSQMTETIRTIKGYPRNHHYHSINWEYIRPGCRWSQK